MAWDPLRYLSAVVSGHSSMGYVIQCPAAEVTDSDGVLYYFLGSVPPRIWCQLRGNSCWSMLLGHRPFCAYLVSCAYILPEENVQFNPFFLFLPGDFSGYLERNLKVPDLKAVMSSPSTLQKPEPCQLSKVITLSSI